MDGPLPERLTETRSSPERHSDSVEIKFYGALEGLFSEIRDTPNAAYRTIPFEADLFPFLYTSAQGAQCADDLFAGRDSNYRYPQEEFTFVNENRAIFSSLIVPHALYASLGDGPPVPVTLKDLPTARSTNPSGYVAIDIEKGQAKLGAEIIRQKAGIPSDFLSIDFMEPFNLRGTTVEGQVVGNRPIFMTMYGGTAGNVNIPKLLTNLSNATDGKAVMLFTMGAKLHPSVVNQYRGNVSEQFMQSLWQYAGDVIANRGPSSKGKGYFNPSAFTPVKDYDHVRHAVTHDFVVTGETYAPFGTHNKWMRIPPGVRIRIGSSVQIDQSQISQEIAAAGWNIINAPFQTGGLVKAMVISAPKTPREWIPVLKNAETIAEKDGHYTPANEVASALPISHNRRSGPDRVEHTHTPSRSDLIMPRGGYAHLRGTSRTEYAS